MQIRRSGTHMNFKFRTKLYVVFSIIILSTCMFNIFLKISTNCLSDFLIIVSNSFTLLFSIITTPFNMINKTFYMIF